MTDNHDLAIALDGANREIARLKDRCAAAEAKVARVERFVRLAEGGGMGAAPDKVDEWWVRASRLRDALADEQARP